MEAALVVLLLIVPVLAALVLVLRRGGLASLANVRVRGAPWALSGAALQALRSADPAWAAGVLHAAGGALVPLGARRLRGRLRVRQRPWRRAARSVSRSPSPRRAPSRTPWPPR